MSIADRDGEYRKDANWPADDWHRLAWAGALVLVPATAGVSLLARLATRGRVTLGA